MGMGYVTKYTDPKPPFPRMCKISNSEQIVTGLQMRQNDRWQSITEIWIALLENDPSQHGGHFRIAAAKVLVILVHGRVILCRCTAVACAVTQAHTGHVLRQLRIAVAEVRACTTGVTSVYTRVCGKGSGARLQELTGIYLIN